MQPLKRFKLLDITDNFRSTINLTRSELGLSDLNRFLNERLVYSYLAFRSRLKTGAGINELVHETRLHKQTVNNVLTHLQAFVHQHDGKWFANEPSAGHVHLIDNPKKTEHWSDRCRYVIYYPPAPQAKVSENGRRFGVKHAVVFAMLASFTKQANPNNRISIQLISRLTEIDRKTVSSIFDDLLRLRLMEYAPRGILLTFSDAHLSLFQKREEIQPAHTPHEAAPSSNGKYDFKQDGCDELRRLCELWFAQSHAEKAIQLAKRLGLNDSEFENELRMAKTASDENVRSGKCPYPNLGKFFVNRLQKRLDERQRFEAEEEAEMRRQVYLNSPEYKAKRKAEELAARANPLHLLHTINHESITDRVRFSDDTLANRRAAEDISRKVGLHCRNHVISLHLPPQQAVDEAGSLHHTIMAHALHKLNQHYGKETAATRKELEQVIDEEASRLAGMGPVFDT